MYYIPLFFLFVSGASGVQTALRLLPFVVSYVFVLLLGGFVIPRVGHPTPCFLVSGLCLVGAGAGLYAAVDASTPPALIYGLSVLGGAGLMTSQSGYGLAAQHLRVDHQSAQAGLVQLLNLAAGGSETIVLAMASAIFQSRAFAGLKDVLAGMGFSDAEIRGAVAGSRSHLLEILDEGTSAKCLDVVVTAIGKEWILVVVAGSLQVVCSLFLTSRRCTPKGGPRPGVWS